MIDIKLHLHHNPIRPEEPRMMIARAKSRGKYTFDMLADDISHSCSLTRADVAGCMEALIEKTTEHILDGYTVEYRGLGTFMLKVDSDRATSEETETRGFRIDSMIKDYRLRFLPAIQIRRKLRDLAEPRLLREGSPTPTLPESPTPPSSKGGGAQTRLKEASAAQEVLPLGEDLGGASLLPFGEDLGGALNLKVLFILHFFILSFFHSLNLCLSTTKFLTA